MLGPVETGWVDGSDGPVQAHPAVAPVHLDLGDSLERPVGRPDDAPLLAWAKFGLKTKIFEFRNYTLQKVVVGVQEHKNPKKIEIGP